MSKLKEILNIIFRKNEEGDVNKMKTKWSWKKKLAVGGGILGTLIAGVFALGKYNEKEVETEDFYEDEDFDEDCDDSDESDLDDEVSETGAEAQL